jgi:hypothetical protein
MESEYNIFKTYENNILFKNGIEFYNFKMLKIKFKCT